jgi:hypothetical protein
MFGDLVKAVWPNFKFSKFTQVYLKRNSLEYFSNIPHFFKNSIKPLFVIC